MTATFGNNLIHIGLEMIRKVAIAATAFALAAATHANAATVDNRDARSLKTLAHDCARVIRDQTDQSKFELVRLIERSGRANYSLWLNSQDDSMGAYCTVKHGVIANTFVKEKPWRKTAIYRPTPNTLAKR